MASDLEIRTKTAFIDNHFELAADLLSQAIAVDSKNAELFADRAQANLKLENFPDAVNDCNRAIELDHSTSEAYLLKATACMKLKEYETAKAALETGASLEPGNSRFSILIKECDLRIAEETGALPNPSPENPITNVEPPLESKPSEENVGADKDSLPVDSISSTAQKTVTSTKPRFRHEHYQKHEEFVLTIFAKGIPATSVAVDFGEQILNVSIDVPGEDPYHFQPRLFGKIVPANCKYEVLTTKVEIHLAKAEPIHWTSLEFSSKNTVVQQINVPSALSQKPTYPSSKPQTTDWDKLEALVKKEEKEEKLDGDAALNKFFQDIYLDADDDTKRAMRKSFVESSGTVLSTNWKDVGSKKVEASAPDGMEMKKW